MRSLLLALLLLLPFAPSAAAQDGFCATEADWNAPCSFHCDLGSTVVVEMHANYGNVASGTAECGGATASCSTTYGYCTASSGSTAMLPGEGTCAFTQSAGPNDVLYCYTVTDPSFVREEVPGSSTPGVGGGFLVTPEVGTPGVGSISSPEVGVPATCQDALCTQPIVVGPVVVPSENPCARPVVCIGPTDPITVVGPADLGSVCTLAAPACLPAGPTLLPAGAVTTPALGPVTVLGPQAVPLPFVAPVGLPGAAAYVNRTGIDGGAPQVGTQHVQDEPVTGPPVPITLCPAPGCDLPALYGNGVVTVAVRVGDVGVSQDVSV